MKRTYSNIHRMLVTAKASIQTMGRIDPKKKDAALHSMAAEIIRQKDEILRANERDLAKHAGALNKATADRLMLNTKRLDAMAGSLRTVAGLKDPIGHMYEFIKRPNGLLIGKMRVPLGVIMIVYESRPNVTSDCIGLCLKSGNSVILRGGSEALNSNRAIFEIMDSAARRHGIPQGAITLVTDTDRAVVNYLLRQYAYIDLVIPRGGESLIRKVAQHSRIPVIKHYKGICHTFVDRTADLAMAEKICLNAKVQRPGVCNAMETLLVHEAVAKRFLPRMIGVLRSHDVEVRGCPRTRSIVRGVKLAKEIDWYTEYLDLILSVRVVSGLDEAIAHIMKYGSHHSDAIITEDHHAASVFTRSVDSAAVYVNASTRFTDGYEFGKGAEIGISTDKIHARGPMGLEELTSYKYVVVGNGQVRKYSATQN